MVHTGAALGARCSIDGGVGGVDNHVAPLVLGSFYALRTFDVFGLGIM